MRMPACPAERSFLREGDPADCLDLAQPERAVGPVPDRITPIACLLILCQRAEQVVDGQMRAARLGAG
jgi:hypothetical protein